MLHDSLRAVWFHQGLVMFAKCCLLYFLCLPPMVSKKKKFLDPDKHTKIITLQEHVSWYTHPVYQSSGWYSTEGHVTCASTPMRWDGCIFFVILEKCLKKWPQPLHHFTVYATTVQRAELNLYTCRMQTSCTCVPMTLGKFTHLTLSWVHGHKHEKLGPQEMLVWTAGQFY